MESKQIRLRKLELEAQLARNHMIPHLSAIQMLKGRLLRYRKNYNYVKSVNKRMIARWKEATNERVKSEYLTYIRINDKQLDEFLRLSENEKNFLKKELELYEKYHQMLIEIQRQIDAINLEN